MNKKLLLLALPLFLLPLCSLVVSNPALATEAHAPSAEQRLESISTNCSSIKLSLSQLERADSRTRTYLGAIYETALGRFISPLNLRLSRNNQSDNNLLALQAEFAAAQSDFRSSYTDYMREMDLLLGIDCTSRPADFVAQLDSTRTKRETLRLTTAHLSALMERQFAAVEGILHPPKKEDANGK